MGESPGKGAPPGCTQAKEVNAKRRFSQIEELAAAPDSESCSRALHALSKPQALGALGARKARKARKAQGPHPQRRGRKPLGAPWPAPKAKVSPDLSFQRQALSCIL